MAGMKLKLGSVITLNKRRSSGIIWLRRKRCVIYRLDSIFSIIHAAQLMVPKINFFCQRGICRYLWRDIQREISNFIPWQKVEEWQLLIVSMWHFFKISGEIAVCAHGKGSNFKLEEPRCFWENSTWFSEERCCWV